MARGAALCVLLVSLLASSLAADRGDAPASSGEPCAFGTAPMWVEHCAIADDCTTEDGFCPCCKAYPYTAYVSACGVICTDETRGTGLEAVAQAEGAFEYVDFSNAETDHDEQGPFFDHPQLSFVGDAAVMVGDCYNLDIVATEQLDGHLSTCLTPPLPERMFPTDPRLLVNLSVCPTKAAPFHAEDPATLAAMLCFDECGMTNTSEAPVPPPKVDEEALFIAACTRACFQECMSWHASGCAANCSSRDYRCFFACHANVTFCSVPMAQRNLRTFSLDPNEEVCYDLGPKYAECVTECNEGCHYQLYVSKRTPEDAVHDWYQEECHPPVTAGFENAVACIDRCGANCTFGCNETATAYSLQEGYEYGHWDRIGPVLTDCTKTCNRGCIDECMRNSSLYEITDPCRPRPPTNCSARCFDTCEVAITYCTVYNDQGHLRHIDPNCTSGFNVTFDPSWANASVSALLEDPSSMLSIALGVNASYHTCYNECDNSSAPVMITGRPTEGFGHNCTTTCYHSACILGCLANCSISDEIAALPECVIQPNCSGPLNCTLDIEPCSWEKTFGPHKINITEVVGNDTSIFVPEWNIGVCEGIIEESAMVYFACVSNCSIVCDEYCFPELNYTRTFGLNDTSGACQAACYPECAANCSTRLLPNINTTWCATPTAPVSLCAPPPTCYEACTPRCLDGTFLRTFPGCEVDPNLVSNLTIISLPMSYNRSTDILCARNMTMADGTRLECPPDQQYYNVTEFYDDVNIHEYYFEDCHLSCVATCFVEYCTQLIEEPANETATCLPRCLDRFMVEPLVSTSQNSRPNTTNITACLSGCHSACVGQHLDGCNTLCDPIIDADLFQGCYSACVGDATNACSQDCLFNCTSNHTLAYGYPEPYDASDDYWTAREFWAQTIAGEPNEFPLQWTNASYGCYDNCSLNCASSCFAEAVGLCEAEAKEADHAVSTSPPLTPPRTPPTASGGGDSEGGDDAGGEGVPISMGLPPPQPGPSQTHPRLIAEAFNNCTKREAALCLIDCATNCALVCQNATDMSCDAECQEERALKLAAQEEEDLLDLYIETCEQKCRVQIYGRNITHEEECMQYYPTFFGDCVNNCTALAIGPCTAVNTSIDIVATCNTTCMPLYVDVGAEAARRANLANQTVDEDQAAVPGEEEVQVVPLEDLSNPYDNCMDDCLANYTDSPNYVCDGGSGAARAREEFRELQRQVREDKGITPREQLEMDARYAALPRGDLCYAVDLGCVFNSSRHCEPECADRVAYYQQLCFYTAEVRRNATFEYNITGCRHPDGWRIGQPVWQFYRFEVNVTHPLAKKPPRPWPVFTYDDVEDSTFLNCSCHFYNETFDPAFEAAMLEYRMRPFHDHFVSQCLCLFNATAGGPQHCIHSNFSAADILFDWVFRNETVRGPDVDRVALTAEGYVDCADGCVPHCYDWCGAYFVEFVDPQLYNGSSEWPRFNTTCGSGAGSSRCPPGLVDWNDTASDVLVHGYWHPTPGCYEGCMSGCAVANCTIGCRDGPSVPGSDNLMCADNRTAVAFGCEVESTKEEGRPMCYDFCGCHADCAAECVSESLALNTSSQRLAHFPRCIANCSAPCITHHYALCVNVSKALAAARIPKFVNSTAVCLSKIWPTCSLHCLGIPTMNITVNTSLFPAHELPDELLIPIAQRIDAVHDAHGYECTLVECPVEEESCNRVWAQIGLKKEKLVWGNYSYTPIMANVTTKSHQGCVSNRTSSCLTACSEIAYRVCVPEADPFDICIESCVANLTYVPPELTFEHSLAVCKKKVRLTPAESDRVGAVWHHERQHVREGFSTNFSFKIDHWSRRCATGSHPSHEQMPETHQHMCQLRGGDGFAFVLQDSGHTAYEASCAAECVDGCISNSSQTCIAACRTLCPGEMVAEGSTCLASCLVGQPTALPYASYGGTAEASPPEHLSAAASSCGAFAVSCASECLPANSSQQLLIEALWEGAALSAGGCIFDCIQRGVGAKCEEQCPLVDEDFDYDCLDACAAAVSQEALGCFGSCNSSCRVEAQLQLEACESDCSSAEAVLPNGDTVGFCTASALAHPVHASAACLTGCQQHDLPCLTACAKAPPGHVVNCVGACPQNDTLCVGMCLESREQLGASCILPCVQSCPYLSMAIGEGSDGIGYRALHNALVVKFDTWFNPDNLDPWLNHIAVHSGGASNGASSRLEHALGVSSDIADLADGKYHTVGVEYEAGVLEVDGSTSLRPAVASFFTTAQRGSVRYMGALRVSLDGRLVLKIPMVLEDVLRLHGGKAFVGFTGATGSAYQEHAIAHWVWRSVGPSEAVEDAEPENEHCRYRVPSLMDGADYVHAQMALACTPEVMDARTPPGAMHSVRCEQEEGGVIVCFDPNMPNVRPVQKKPLHGLTATVGVPFTHSFAADTFVDMQPDGKSNGSLLVYSVHSPPYVGDALDAWLSFDAATRTLYGTPLAPGTWPLVLTATDPGFREGKDKALNASVTLLVHVVELIDFDRAKADHWHQVEDLRVPTPPPEQEPRRAEGEGSLQGSRGARVAPALDATAAAGLVSSVGAIDVGDMLVVEGRDAAPDDSLETIAGGVTDYTPGI